MGPRERPFDRLSVVLSTVEGRRAGGQGTRLPRWGPRCGAAPHVRPLYGALREFCSRCERRIAVGAPQARPPERSGHHGAPRAEAWGVRGGEAPRIWLMPTASFREKGRSYV